LRIWGIECRIVDAVETSIRGVAVLVQDSEVLTMHVTGKFGVWLVVLAAVSGTLLTTKFIQVRNSWTKRAVIARNEFRILAPKIAELQEQFNVLEREKFRSLGLWGNSTSPIQTSVQAQGKLVVDLGAEAKTGIAEKKILYGFEVRPDNSVVYRGDFTLDNVRDVQSQLTPNWRVRPEDVAAWQSGKWRWRNQLPSSIQENFDRLLLLVGEAEFEQNDRLQTLAVQEGLLAQSQEQLALREAELIGGEQLSNDPKVGVEHREGLVVAVEQIEETRNNRLTKIDQLRRKLKSVQSEVDRLQTRNVELTKKLPKPVLAPALSQQ